MYMEPSPEIWISYVNVSSTANHPIHSSSNRVYTASPVSGVTTREPSFARSTVLKTCTLLEGVSFLSITVSSSRYFVLSWRIFGSIQKILLFSLVDLRLPTILRFCPPGKESIDTLHHRCTGNPCNRLRWLAEQLRWHLNGHLKQNCWRNDCKL